MNFFILTCLTLGVTQNNDLVFPLWVDYEGNFVTNVSIPMSGERNIPAVVNMGSINTFLCNTPMEIGSAVSLRRETGSFVWDDESVILSDHGNQSYLTIGPQSVLTRTTGSVALIRRGNNAADLVVRSSFDYFNATCTPGSLMQISFTENLRVNGTFSVLDDEPTSLGTIRLHNVGTDRISLPIPVVEDVLANILGAGATSIGSEYDFENCTEEMFAGLPNINLFIQTSDGNVSRIVYFPEDYASISNGICRIRVALPSDGIPRFNPLAISSTNIRVSSDNVLELCDALDY